MTVFRTDETLDDIAKEGASDTQLKFRDGLKVLLTEVTRLRTKVVRDAVDTDDATDLVTHAALILKTGRKVVVAHQPLELGSLAPTGRHELGSSRSSDNPEIDRTTERFRRELMKHQGNPDFNRTLARIADVLNGESDETEDLRRQLRDAQKKLEGYKPLQPIMDALEKVTDRADRARRLKSAQDAFNDVVVGNPAGDTDSELTKAQSDLATAKSELANAKKDLTAAQALLRFFKDHSKSVVLSNRKVTITFDEHALKPDLKAAWENV